MPSSSLRDPPQSCGTFFRVTAIILGFVTMLAASLKGHQIVTDSIFSTDTAVMRLSMIFFIHCECVLGIMLLFGAYPRLIRVLTACCYSCFFLVALHEVFVGKPSCGCFGNVSVTPILMAVFDFCAVVALVCFRPSSRIYGLQAISDRCALACGFLFLTICFPLSLVLSFAGHGAIEPFPHQLDFGQLRRGESMQLSFNLHNPNSTEVTLDKIAASCKCLHVDLDSESIKPGMTVHGTVTFDTSSEPDFVGDLDMEIKGTGSGQTTGFTIRLQAIVR